MKLGISLGRKHQIFIGLILTRKRKTTNMPCHPEAIPLKQFKKGITTNHTPNYNRINAQSGIQLFRGGGKRRSRLLGMKLCFMPSGLFNSWPLQFLRTGLYHRSYGYLNVRTTGGYWWSDTAGSATNGRYLVTWTGSVLAQNNLFRGRGFALRCIAQNPRYLKAKLLICE